VSTRLVDLIGLTLDEFLAQRAPEVSAIAPELIPFIDYSSALLRGGKRFRALFCYWGWSAVGAGRDGFDPLESLEPPRDLASVVDVAAGLETFHAAALVHDDIMDHSDTRRGMPAVHKRFETLHAESGWTGSRTDFGLDGGLLLGDLLLAWSDELIEQGLALLDSRPAANAARAEFNRMRRDVTAGQYLDVLEERSWRNSPERDQLARAHRVLVYKSAKYSVEAPLVIGGSMGGGTDAQVAALRAFGLPLGIAYQLRDDILGVFGDPAVTGKPAGDDLREGKRTVLIAIARADLPPTASRLLDELLGDPELEPDQIRMLQRTLIDAGSVDKVERMIAHNVELARAALNAAPLERAAIAELDQLAGTVINRTA
jgi:geranylgeranyl diphosphate synthase type I